MRYADRSTSMHEAAKLAVEALGMSILIDEDTTFIVQGITGREAVNLTRECLDYGAGAKVVGGVTPGRLGREVHGVPVFDTVAAGRRAPRRRRSTARSSPSRPRSPRTPSSRRSRTASS